MKVIYTDEARENLDGILAYIAANYPTVYEPFLIRLRSVIARIGMWPDSAQEVAEEPGVRAVPLLRYPYKIFYRNTGEANRDHVHPSCRAGRTSGYLSQLSLYE